MPKTTPLPNWAGEEVFIIGGGSSLRHFDFSQLNGLCTIGCNQAFKLGAALCNICVFGDNTFWLEFSNELRFEYGGWVATNYVGIPPRPWLHAFPRQGEGLDTTALAWNGNTGCLAVNLALMLGATTVNLLGIDLALGPVPNQSHWHGMAVEVPTAEHYHRFGGGFGAVAAALPEVFPGRNVYNVHGGASNLKSFPVRTFAQAGLVPPRSF